jgi:histidine ammonia-lyase
MGHLSARRLEEMLALGERLLAVQLVIAGQALDLRRREGTVAFGVGTDATLLWLRNRVPFMASIESFPADLDPLVAAIHQGDLMQAPIPGLRKANDG